MPAQVAAEHTALLTAWNIGPLRACTIPESGTLNDTLLVTAERSRFVLRGYRRHGERAAVAREHAVIAHARARGVPAVAPLPLPNGDTILERDGRCYALFPFAPGYQVRRAALGPAEAAAMGACLSHLHQALRDFPQAGLERQTVTANRDQTLAGVEQLLAIIARQPTKDATDLAAQDRLISRRDWLSRQPPTIERDLTTLDPQTIHGDYHEANLFFADGQVCAIIDWERVRVAPHAMEAVRTLDLAFGLVPALCRAFVTAYRTVAPLPLAELDAAADAYGLMRAYDLWVFTEVYLEGNDRVRQFISPGRYQPFAARWAALRGALV
ncbi:MAG: phosphotransferase [Thermomicrobiales bacterium]